MSIEYYDLQLNGYAGVDFNQDDLSTASLEFACEKLRRDGVKGVLATIITAEIERMVHRLRRLVEISEQSSVVAEMIVGIHIEGPFLTTEKGYYGAHNPRWIQQANTETMKKLLDGAGHLACLVTLAPESDPGFKVTRLLVGKGLTVSAGHTNADLETLNAAIENGLSMFTHLGNGCPVNMDRHDNIIQRVLSLGDKIWKTFIADGLHIPPFALKNYLALAGFEKSIIVTDAMAAASADPGIYSIGEIELEVGRDGVVRRPGDTNFAGSAVTMKKSRKILEDYLNLSDDQIKRIMSNNPKRAIGPGGE